ncbi:ATP-grasp domain-containing protein [Shewanella algae]|uniref:ATP-grasp domain-containing protein n=1 Tax=Shewanella algae TaxID=38313 RepID=UPI001AAD5C3C|nr:ATP-grasp domain-containing protein [Shewanella algae]MBO2657583.1 ATP-grasp domain-containing protein [Shewanella algae]
MNSLPLAILIIGAGHMQLEHVRWAKSLNLVTVVTDIRDDAPAIGTADEYYQIGGNDVPGLTALAMRLSQRFKLVGAYSGSDFGLPAVAVIHKLLGIPGCTPEAVTLSLNKSATKQAWLSQGLPTPKMALWTDIPSRAELLKLTYPIIIKPLDSCGSQGVTSVNTQEEVADAVAIAKQYGDQVLMEEYFDGYGIDTIGIMWQGEFIPCGLGDRYFSTPPFHFPTHGFTPSTLSKQDKAMAYQLTEQACRMVGLDNTPVKADLLYKDGRFTLLEVSPRFHGDVFTTKLIPFSGAPSPVLQWFAKLAGVQLSKLDTDNIATKTVMWKALFPLAADINFANVEAYLREHFNLIEFFYESRRYKKHNQHSDNTSLVGFFWVQFNNSQEAEDFLTTFSNRFEGILL